MQTPYKITEPVIVSASRATDIPAFYPRQLIAFFKKGLISKKNRFDSGRSLISLTKARLIVFWSKNPAPLIPLLPYFEQKGIRFYFQFTLNDYDKEKFEPRVPPLAQRIETFKQLSGKLGPERVIWRFDPIWLTAQTEPAEMLDRIGSIARQLKDHTTKLIFSFADTTNYKHVKRNVEHRFGSAEEAGDETKLHFAKQLARTAQEACLTPLSCAERLDLSSLGIGRAACIDQNLIFKLFNHDAELMEFLGYREEREQLFFSKQQPQNSAAGSTELPDRFSLDGRLYLRKQQRSLKDRGQRKNCLCIKAKDIGAYDTCPHGCLYCYANSTPQSGLAAYRRLHKQKSSHAADHR